MATVIRGGDNFDTADNATQTELDAKVVGKVLQVASSSDSTSMDVGNGVYADTGMSVTMTPASVNSKFFAVWSIQANLDDNEGFGCYLDRNGTHVFESLNTSTLPYGVTRNRGYWGFNELDAPNTTAPVTYTVGVLGFGVPTINNYGTETVLTVMEISE